MSLPTCSSTWKSLNQAISNWGTGAKSRLYPTFCQKVGGKWGIIWPLKLRIATPSQLSLMLSLKIIFITFLSFGAVFSLKFITASSKILSMPLTFCPNKSNTVPQLRLPHYSFIKLFAKRISPFPSNTLYINKFKLVAIFVIIIFFYQPSWSL